MPVQVFPQRLARCTLYLLRNSQKVPCVLEAFQGRACDKEQIIHLAVPIPAAGMAPRPHGHLATRTLHQRGPLVMWSVLNSVELL